SGARHPPPPALQRRKPPPSPGPSSLRYRVARLNLAQAHNAGRCPSVAELETVNLRRVARTGLLAWHQGAFANHSQVGTCLKQGEGAALLPWRERGPGQGRQQRRMGSTHGRRAGPGEAEKRSSAARIAARRSIMKEEGSP